MKLRRLSSECRGGTCPAVYETDDGQFVVQGVRLKAEERTAVKLSPGEDAVRIPKDVLVDVLNCMTK